MSNLDIYFYIFELISVKYLGSAFNVMFNTCIKISLKYALNSFLIITIKALPNIFQSIWRYVFDAK